MSLAISSRSVTAEGPRRRGGIDGPTHHQTLEMEIPHHGIERAKTTASSVNRGIDYTIGASHRHEIKSPLVLSATALPVGLYQDYNDAYDLVGTTTLQPLPSRAPTTTTTKTTTVSLPSSAPSLSQRSDMQSKPTPELVVEYNYDPHKHTSTSPQPVPVRLVGTVWDTYMDYPSSKQNSANGVDASPSPLADHFRNRVELTVDPLKNLLRNYDGIKPSSGVTSHRASIFSSQRPPHVVLPAENLVLEGPGRYADPTLTHLPLSEDSSPRDTRQSLKKSSSSTIDAALSKSLVEEIHSDTNDMPLIRRSSPPRRDNGISSQMPQYDSNTLETIAPTMSLSEKRGASAGEARINEELPTSPSSTRNKANATNAADSVSNVGHYTSKTFETPKVAEQNQKSQKTLDLSSSDNFMAYYRTQFAKQNDPNNEAAGNKERKREKEYHQGKQEHYTSSADEVTEREENRKKKEKKNKQNKRRSLSSSDNRPTKDASTNSHLAVSAPSISARHTTSHANHSQYYPSPSSHRWASQSPSYDFRTEQDSNASSLAFYEEEGLYDEEFALYKRPVTTSSKQQRRSDSSQSPKGSGGVDKDASSYLASKHRQRTGSQHSPRSPLRYAPQPNVMTSPAIAADNKVSLDLPTKPEGPPSRGGRTDIDGYQHTPLDSALAPPLLSTQGSESIPRQGATDESSTTVFGRLYATGLISAARNELKHRRAVEEKAKDEEDAALRACTFHPITNGGAISTPRAGTPKAGAGKGHRPASPLTPNAFGSSSSQIVILERPNGRLSYREGEGGNQIVAADDGTAQNAEVFQRLANEALSRRKRQERRVAEQKEKDEKAILAAQQKVRPTSAAPSHLTTVSNNDIPLHEKLYKQALSRNANLQRLAERHNSASNTQCTFTPELIFKTNPAAVRKPQVRSRSRTASPSNHEQQQNALNHPPMIVSAASQSSNVIGNINGFSATAAGPGAIVPFTSPNKRLSAEETAEKEKQRDRLAAMAQRARERQAQRCELMAKKDEEEEKARHLEATLMKERSAARAELGHLREAIARQERFNAQLEVHASKQKRSTEQFAPKHHATVDELMLLGM